jgi:hypothetical protein
MADYEDSIRRKIRNDIVRRNQLPGPLSYDAERMLEKCVEIEREILEYKQKYRPSYRAWGDDE